VSLEHNNLLSGKPYALKNHHTVGTSSSAGRGKSICLDKIMENRIVGLWNTCLVSCIH
jgi:hypothetical protein